MVPWLIIGLRVGMVVTVPCLYELGIPGVEAEVLLNCLQHCEALCGHQAVHMYLMHLNAELGMVSMHSKEWSHAS